MCLRNIGPLHRLLRDGVDKSSKLEFLAMIKYELMLERVVISFLSLAEILNTAARRRRKAFFYTCNRKFEAD